MKYLPVNSYLLCTPPPPPSEKSEGGLYIPETSRKKTNEGCIVAIGPDASAAFAIGDTVVFTEHSEYRVMFDDREYILVQAENVVLRSPA